MHAILLSLMLTAPGEALWVGVWSVDVELTPSEKALVGTAVNGAFGISGAAVDVEECKQNVKAQHSAKAFPVLWRCEVAGEVTLSDEQFWVADLAGAIQDPAAATALKTMRVDLSAAQQAQHEAVSQAVFNEALSGVHSMEIWRDAGKILAKYKPIETGTKTEYRAARVAGEVSFPVAEVP